MAFKLKLGKIDKPWAKSAAAVVGGGVAGVFVDKIVGDVFLATGIPNPQYVSIQMHDVLLVAGEIWGAYHFKTKKPLLSKALLGMATAVVVTDTYEVVAASGRWLSYAPMVQRTAMPLKIRPARPAMMNGIASAGLSYPQTGVAGKYMLKTNGSSAGVASMGRYR